MTPRNVSATDFKARCLALMDEVEETGQEIIVTKRGRPVARILPVEPKRAPDLQGSIEWMSDDFEEPLNEPWFAWQNE